MAIDTIKTIDESLAARLGNDTSFPITENFDNIEGLSALIQDIQLLLLTVPGERVGRPEFGCELRNQLWENEDTVAQVGKGNIKEALDKFEPRIKVTGVSSTINRNTGLITFNIKFLVTDTDVATNLVFPVRTTQQISSQ